MVVYRTACVNVFPSHKMVKDIRVRLLTVFLWLPLVQHTLSVLHSSDLCGKQTEYASCQSQLENRNSSEADCQVKFLRLNSESCKKWNFEGSPGQSRVKLAAYLHTEHGYYRPAINISFLHINWSHLRFRIKPNNQNSSKNICREIHVSVKFPDTQQLYYDCPWADPHDSDYKGQNYNIEYETSSNSGPGEYGKLSLEIPSHLEDDVKDIKNWTLFVYLDTTNAPLLTVHWTPAPRWIGDVKYDVRSYIVTLHYSTNPGSSNEDVQVLSEVGANQDLQFTHNLGATAGAYRFGVQIVDPACGTNGCRVSFSPTITSEGHSRHFLIIVIVCSLLIPVVLCVLYVLIKWVKLSKIDVKPPPVVLIIYIPTHKAHIRVVKELAIYLHSYCGVEVLLHDIDVPRDNVEELQSWFSDAYERANFVMVVSSPLQHTALRETIYVNAGEIGLKFLRLKFVDPNIPPENFLCVVLPYCSKQDLPRDVVHFRRISLMHDLDEMLRHLQSEWGGARGKALSLLRFNVPGGSAQYKVHGRKLAAAIAEATIAIQKDDGVRPVAVHSGEHADGTLCSPQSVIPEVQEEAETLLDHYLEAEHHAKVHSPFFPTNVLSALQVETNQPSRKPTTRHFINPGMKL